jgi:EmrB/QacA subfamily drug resistance transporter
MSVATGTREGRLVLLATVLGSGVVFLDATIVNVALPALGRALGAGLGQLQWTVDAYLLTLTAFLLPGGALGDRLGRRRVFVWGLLCFGATSALCGLAPSPAALAAARALQGVAGALLVPGSLAVLRASFRAEDEGRAIGAWAALSGVTTAAGPLAGGWLAGAVSWRAIFLVNLPLVAAATLAAIRFVPESRDPGRGRPDLAGGALAALGLGLVVFALIGAGEAQPGQRATLLPAALAGGACLALFLALEARRAAPMLPLGLFRAPAFAGANSLTLAVYFALGGAMFLTILQLQAGLGWSPVAAGAALMPVTAIMLALSPAAGRLTPRHGPALLTAGPVVIALGLLLLGRLAPGARWSADVLPGAAALGLGLALTVAPLTATVLGAAPPAKAGVASAVNNAISRLGGLLAVAVLPVAAGIAPADLAAGRFTDGYRRAMTLAAALAAAGGLVAALTLRPSARARRRRPAPPPRAAPAARARARAGRRAPPPRAPAPPPGSRPRG